MKSQNKHSFEEEWRNAFDGAEEATDDALWARLDSHLANKEAIRYKNKFRHFSIAATLALLLISLGITAWWFNHNNQHQESLSGINPDKVQSIQTDGFTKEPNNSINRSKAANAGTSHEHASTKQAAAGNPTAIAQGTTIPSGAEAHIAQQSSAQDNIVANDHISGTRGLFPQRKETTASSLPDDQTAKPAAIASAHQGTSERPAVAQGSPMDLDATSEEKNKHFSQPSGLRANAAASANIKSGKVPSKTYTVAKSPSIAIVGKVESTESAGIINHEAKSATGTPPAYAGPANASKSSDSTLQARSFKPLPVQLPVLSPPDWSASLIPAGDPVAMLKPSMQKKNWWISAVFTPLYFNPNFRVNYQQTAYSTAPSPTHAGIGSFKFEDIVKPDFSYLLSLEAGRKISRRWQVKTGLQYLHYNSTLNTRAFFEPDGTEEKIPLVTRMLNQSKNQQASFDRLPGTPMTLNTSETTVTLHNQYQYLSVPLQAGFVLNPDAPITFVLTTGLAADFFLMNTLKGDDESIHSASINSRENSIYRTVTFTGLLGVDISYSISDRYSISFQPLCRTALHSSTNKNATINSKPFTAGAGLGLKFGF